MGLMSWIFGGPVSPGTLGNSVSRVAEVFRPNATRKMELSHQAYAAAQGSHLAEFQFARSGVFDGLVNGLNRLPRPMLALGTLGLFVFAMVDPEAFATRMTGLAHVPDPLWWLLGAIVSFYFGAREAHYFRKGSQMRAAVAQPPPRVAETGAKPRGADGGNAALIEWQAAQDQRR